MKTNYKFLAALFGFIFWSFTPLLASANDCVSKCKIATGVKRVGPYTLKTEKNLWKDIPAQSPNGELNVVIEIPTGTTEKWETRKSDGALIWDMKSDQPRVVNYIGYPGNYGMIPQTMLPKELGGDGDPLDVIVLGPPLLQGSIAPAKLVGVLKLLDNGEQDDKLIAVSPTSAFSELYSIKELNQQFPGVTQILETWFVNYKSVGEMRSLGFEEVDQAESILQKALKSYQELEK